MSSSTSSAGFSTISDDPPRGETPRPAQTLSVVFRAELGRALRQGGWRRGLLVTLLVGTGIGVVTAAVLGFLTGEAPDDAAGAVATVPLEVAVWCTAIILAVTVVLHFGRRNQDGITQISLTFVPRRRRLLLARTLAVTSVGFVVGVTVAVVVAAAGLAMVGSTADLAPVALAVLLGALATTLLAVIAFAVAALTTSTVAALLVLVGWWIVVPVVLSSTTPLLPAWLSTILDAIARSTPTTLLGEATTVTTLASSGAGPVVTGLLGLIAWIAVLGIATDVMFRRRGI